MVKTEELGIGFHYLDGDIKINLNKIFFKDVYENSNVEIAVDGYIILEDNIGESLKQETLEKIYQLYKKHGMRFIERVKSGRFNILVFDKKVKKIFVANSYVGSLPFYYTVEKPFKFSSNLLNLENELCPKEIDWYGISQYLKYAFFMDDRTRYKHIKFLPPHSIMEFSITKETIKIYSYTPKNVNVLSDLEKLFKKACKRLYTEDIEYSLGLSGGIDSRFVLYHWPNKENLSLYTRIPENADDAARDDLEIATKLVSKLDMPIHKVIKNKIMGVKELTEYLKKFDPFEIRKLSVPESNRLPKVIISGDFAPIISGEWLLLRHKKFFKSILFGTIIPKVTKTVLDEAISRVPSDVFEKYIHSSFKQNIIKVPLEKERYYVENYNIFNRWRRWLGFNRRCFREREIIYPFLDYDFVFSCLKRKDRLNNKLYYSLCKKMPYPYNMEVTRYAFPLSYPYTIQFWSMVIKDTVRRFKPERSHTEEIGGVISNKADIKEYMVKHLERAGLIKNVSELSADLSGGKKGHFFFLSFIVSYWLNEKVITDDQKK